MSANRFRAALAAAALLISPGAQAGGLNLPLPDIGKVIDALKKTQEAPAPAAPQEPLPKNPAAPPTALPPVQEMGNAETVGEPLANDFRGSLSYRGTYSGYSHKLNGAGSRVDLDGAATFELKLDNQAITGRLVPTGLLRAEPLSGVAKDGFCTLYVGRDPVAIRGRCGDKGFVGAAFSGPPNPVQISYDLRLAKMETQEQQQKRAADESQQRRAAAQAAMQLPAPDLAPLPGGRKQARNLVAKLDNVDDLGFVIVRTPDGKWHPVALAEWTQGHPGGAQGSVSSVLQAGENMLVFALHNKMFQFGPGRWSFRFALIGDADALWSRAGGEPGGNVGVRYWRPFVATKQKSGQVEISDPNEAQLASVTAKMKELNDRLIREFGMENSSVAMAFGAAAAAMMPGAGSPSGGGCADSNRSAVTDIQCQQMADQSRRSRQQQEADAAAQRRAAEAQQERLQKPNSLGW